MNRYYLILDAVYLTAANKLNINEQMAVNDACPKEGLTSDQTANAKLWLKLWVEKAISEGCIKQWEVDETKLLETVQEFSTVEALALIDAVEHWWAVTPEERINNAQDLVQVRRLDSRFLSFVK